MRRAWRWLVVFLAAINLGSFATAAVIRVPLEYPSIQAGIDASVDGDTVLVADGTYAGDGNRDIDFLGKAIVVMSENGPEVTIIDCEGSFSEPHRGVYFHSGEDWDSVLQGFTIRNGYVSGITPQDCGGGILCHLSSPTLLDNRIEDNTAVREGGGLHLLYSYANVEGNVISGNTTNGLGGGIYCVGLPTIVRNTIAGNVASEGGGICSDYQSPPIIEHNTIAENTAGEGDGGGIFCRYGSSPTIRQNTLVGNTAAWNGGGIACYQQSSPTIEGNLIIGNATAYGGGGVSCEDRSYPIIVGNRIAGNTVQLSGGGGIFCYEQWGGQPSTTIKGNTITGNVGPSGGGIHCRRSWPSVDGNTIVGNTAYDGGGGICCYHAAPTVTNTVLWGDSANTGSEICVLDGGITVSWSDVQGGSSAVYVSPWFGTLYWEEGNIDADPMFVLPERRDYRLLWDSPCIDAGDPDSPDPDGTRRDIGSQFFDQDDYLTLYLTPDTTEVMPGGILGVTYTVINRWGQSEPFWVETGATLPNGNPYPVMGPDHYALPASYTVQRHMTHNVPGAAPFGHYEYHSKIWEPPELLYDDDSFELEVVEP